MSDKKYYWLKLQRDFFKRHDIRIVEAMPNGKDYILFYMKILLESIGHEGRLRFSEEVPYNAEMLSIITDTNIDVVRTAIQVFCDLGMISVLDDQTIFMNEVQKMIGSETDWAKKKRDYRLKKAEEEQTKIALIDNKEDIVLTMSDKSKSKEKEKEKDIEKEVRCETPYQQIADLYNDTCVSLPKLKTLSDARKKAIKARLNVYTVEDFKEVFKKVEASNFLKGKNNRDWVATFDWIIKDSNMAKILDGNYDDKKGVSNDTVQNTEWNPKTHNFFE
jgi:predicted phage replisome organizer